MARRLAMRPSIREKSRSACSSSAEERSTGCLTLLYVADTMEKARDDFQNVVLWYYRTIAKYIAPGAGERAVKSYEMYTAFRDLAGAASWDLLLEREAVICGSPDYVTERLHDFQQTYGFTDLLCWTRLGGLDHRKVLRSMELMRDKVIPHLRDAQPPPPPVCGLSPALLAARLVWT